MKTKSLAILVAIAVVLGGFWAFRNLGEKRESDHSETKGVGHETSEQHAPPKKGGVTLDKETQQRIGLQVESLTATNLSPELKGYGRVLDPAPLAALTAELLSAQAAAAASSQEVERLKTLSAQSNASVRALQTAEATARRDQLLVQSARDRIALSWGKALAERNDLETFARGLTFLESALVRIDLPAGQPWPSTPTTARLISMQSDERPSEAEFFGASPNVDWQTQGQSFFFLVKTNSPRLSPGAAVTAHLKVGGEAMSGVIVPRSAVLRHEDKAWVYLQTEEATFVRREIVVDRPLDRGWFVSAGLKAEDRLVTVGAQTLLSEERKAEIKAEE